MGFIHDTVRLEQEDADCENGLDKIRQRMNHFPDRLIERKKKSSALLREGVLNMSVILPKDFFTIFGIKSH